MNSEYKSLDKLLILKITEEIDHHTTEKIRRKMDNEITRYMPRKVLFDFNEVSFMDSAGIGLIIGRYKVAKLFGGEVEIANARPSVKKVLDKYNVEIPLWGMYKDDKHRTKGLISQEKEIELDRTSNLYRFVASIQEEVHNYAISYHRSLRNKSLTKSELDDIQGIGEKRKKALLNHFKDIEAIKNATFEELLEVESMNKSSSESVYEYFRKGK